MATSQPPEGGRQDGIRFKEFRFTEIVIKDEELAQLIIRVATERGYANPGDYLADLTRSEFARNLQKKLEDEAKARSDDLAKRPADL